MLLRARQNQQNSPHIVATDDIDSLLHINPNHIRKLLAAIICDERIDVSFRAGVAMSLGARR
jgi:hypothetical protein